MSDRKPIGELLDALGVTTGVTETDRSEIYDKRESA